MKSALKSLSIRRILTSIKADALFQFKHGFYYIYLILTLLYILFVSLLDDSAAKIAIPILIFIDPTVLGMFFIGSIVLLEKEQGLLTLLYVTPLRVVEYMISKLITLAIISILAGLIIPIATYSVSINYLLLAFAILLASVLFTLIGFIVSTKVKSVNEYIVKTIPWMIAFCLPCMLIIPNEFLPKSVYYLLNLVPSVAALKIVLSVFVDFAVGEVIFCIIYLVAIIILLLYRTQRLFTKKVIVER